MYTVVFSLNPQRSHFSCYRARRANNEAVQGFDRDRETDHGMKCTQKQLGNHWMYDREGSAVTITMV